MQHPYFPAFNHCSTLLGNFPKYLSAWKKVWDRPLDNISLCLHVCCLMPCNMQGKTTRVCIIVCCLHCVQDSSQLSSCKMEHLAELLVTYVSLNPGKALDNSHTVPGNLHKSQNLQKLNIQLLACLENVHNVLHEFRVHILHKNVSRN